MVQLVDQGKGCWVRLGADGKVLTPAEYAAARAAERQHDVRFVGIPFAALVGDESDELGVFADEEEFRRVWGERVSLVDCDDERQLLLLNGKLVKADAVERLPPEEQRRVKAKTVPAEALVSHRIDEARITQITQSAIEALMRVRTEIELAVFERIAAVPDKAATTEECYDAWISRLPTARQDALTDALAGCSDDDAREAAMGQQLDELLPGKHAIVFGLAQRDDLNHCCGLVLEPSSDGRFPTRVGDGGEEEVVRVRLRNLWPAD